MNIDHSIAIAYLRLKAPEFDAIRSHLNAVYLEAATWTATVDDEKQWRRLQGRAQLAKELLDLVESSDKLVASLSRPQ